MDLKLNGDKMTLEARPESEIAPTASARSAHLIHGRNRTSTPIMRSQSVQGFAFLEDIFSDEESENMAPITSSSYEAWNLSLSTPKEDMPKNEDKTSDISKPTSSEDISNILADIRNKTNSQIKTLKNIAVGELDFTKNFKSVCAFLEESSNENADVIGDSSAVIMDVKQQLSLFREEKATAQQVQAKRELQLKNELKQLDAVVHRHQDIIDKLTQDKVTLNERCEVLLVDLDQREKHYQRNVHAIENRHKEELRKSREMTLTAEKTRRNEWADKEKKKIKQTTLRAVQSELDSLRSSYESRESDLIAQHKKQMNQSQQEHEASTQAQLESLRQHLSREHEKALSAELKSAQKRAASSLATERQTMEEQCQRWTREYAARSAECEARENAANADKAMAVARAKELCMHELNALKERQEVELALARENSSLGLKKAELAISKRFEEELRAKERQIRNEAQAERNTEIERVIEVFQGDLGKLKDDHQAELQNKCDAHAKERGALNEKITVLYKKLEQRQELIQALKEKCREMAINKNSLKNKVQRLEKEQQNIVVWHGQEMETVQQKVMESITKRDEIICKLKDKINILQLALKD